MKNYNKNANLHALQHLVIEYQYIKAHEGGQNLKAIFMRP